MPPARSAWLVRFASARLRPIATNPSQIQRLLPPLVDTKSTLSCATTRNYGRRERRRQPRSTMARRRQHPPPAGYDVQGPVNSEVFELWVTQMLIPAIQEMYPLGGVCVVMDNARFHRNRVLEDMFAGADIELRFLPSYSPEYNPIETAFAWIKTHVRHTPMRSIWDIPAATYAAFAEVSGDLAKSLQLRRRALEETYS